MRRALATTDTQWPMPWAPEPIVAVDVEVDEEEASALQERTADVRLSAALTELSAGLQASFATGAHTDIPRQRPDYAGENLPMFRLTLAKVAALGTAAASVAGVGALSIAHLGSASAAAAAAQASPTASAPSPSGTTAKDKNILGRALRHRLVKATADATGQTAKQVRAELKSGKSLGQIAGDKVSAIEKTVSDAVKARLDKAVAKGKITADQERDLLGKLHAAIDKEMVAMHAKIAAPAATPSA